jgi:hypothetical protein
MLDRGEGVAAYRPRKDDGDAFGDADTQMQQLQSSTSRFKADRGFKVCYCTILLHIFIALLLIVLAQVVVTVCTHSAAHCMTVRSCA